MKYKKSFFTILGSTIFAAVTMIGVTVAWLCPSAGMGTNNTPIEGVVQDKYYNSGDGLTPETAFEITQPRHLYNLAWLQYLGFYNKSQGVDNHQFYFKLGDNIDMSQFGPIPPIGTELNPFVGNFDGHGYVISGVTISNEFDDYVSHPSSINGWDNQDKKQPHILGLFGIVGDYTNGNKPTNYDTEINEFVNTGITGATIKTVVPDSLMGVAAGYVSGNMSNILVDVSTIDVDSSITGDTSSYGGFTQNISDYTLVGYTRNTANVKKAEQSIYDVEVTTGHTFNAQDEGDNEGWGGSINMKTIYYRLASLRKTKSTDVAGSFEWRTVDYYYNGTLEASEHGKYTSLSTTNGYADGMSRYVGANETGHEYIGNYNIYAPSISTGYGPTGKTTDQSYLYLSGGHYENRTYRTYYDHDFYPITDGTHYLNVYLNNNNVPLLSEGTSYDASTKWTFPSSSNGTITYTFESEGITAYLSNTNGALDVTDSSGSNTNWDISRSNGKLIITPHNQSNLHLKYDTSWLLRDINATADTYFYIYTGSGNSSHYVSSGSTTYYLGATSNRTNAIKWYWDTTYKAFYYMREGNSRYLMNNSNVAIANKTKTQSSAFIRPNGSQNTPTATQTNVGMRDTNSRYMKYSNDNDNGWTMVTSNYSSFTVEKVTDPIDVTDNVVDIDPYVIHGPDYYQSSSDLTLSTNNSHMYYTAEDTTYFPLNVEKDIDSYISNTSTMNSKIAANDLDPKDSNTGYIISGSNISSSATTLSAGVSNIRISEYAISNVNASFNKSAGSSSTINDLPNSKIYTINSSGSTVTMNNVDLNDSTTNYPRYNDSKTSFYQKSLTTAGNNNTFTTNSFVYGLHFMRSTISKTSMVNASKVSILGNTADSYQFPVDCIDFNLKQKGIINFFAGTYFDDNDSFFSLYQIIRNDDAVLKNGSTKDYTSYKTINEIKEIVAVYSTDTGNKTTKYSNIYKYKTIVNGSPVYTYSEPYRFDGNMNKFKMNKNTTDESNIAYVDNYSMSESDFNAYKTTYGYSLRLDAPTQIGKQGSAYTSNRIYYFEIPMNSGEYCLGSVESGTGAYLLYLDIGANAAKTNRTIFYEHFTIDEKTYAYPVGVALQELGDASNYTSGVAVINVNTQVDYSDSACMRIIATAKGEFTIDRDGNNVGLTRAQTNKAPPNYSGDNIERVYETSTSATVNVEHLDTHTYDIRRMQYFDYNVNLEYLTVTTFVDAAEQGQAYTRQYVSQTIYSGSTTSSSAVATYKYYPGASTPIDQRSSMKIYSTSNGVKYDVDDIINVGTISIDSGKMSDDLIVTFRVFQDNGTIYEDVTSIATHIDSNNHSGTYYIYDNYIISYIPTSGSTIIIKIVSLTTGETVYYETTLITGAGQTITEGPQP